MNNTGIEGLRIGLSACLAGETVRYDGAHKRQDNLLRLLADHAAVETFCPEVAAGLGVPRPPVRLIAREDGEARARGVGDPALDVSDALLAASEAFARQRLCKLSGFVFKSRSPSCGLASTPVHDEAGRLLGRGNGLFAGAIGRATPDMPLAEESWLDDEEEAGYRFLSACALFADRQHRREDYRALRLLLKEDCGLEESLIAQLWPTAAALARQAWTTQHEAKLKAALGERLCVFWRQGAPA